MEVANAWLVIDERGSNVPLKGITPAEAVYLDSVRKRHKDDGEKKVIHIKLIGTAKRSSAQEKARLLAKYPIENPTTRRVLLDEVWSGVAPSFPKTFEDAGYEVTNDEPKRGKLLPYPILGDAEPLFARQDNDIELVES